MSQEVLGFVEEELKDGHRDDLNNFKFINIKQSKYTLNDE
jgi:hypothetical protein